MLRYARWFSLALGLALAAALAAAHPAPAQEQETVLVSVAPGAAEVAVGQTGAVAVAVQDVTGLYAVNLELAYDAVSLEVVDTDPSQPGVQVALGLFLDPGFVIRNAADNAAGTLRFTMTQLNPSQPKTGSGNLIVIMLRGKQAASAAALTLTRVELSQRDGTLIEAATAGGVVAVVAASQPGPSPTAIPSQAAGTPLPTGTVNLPEPTAATPTATVPGAATATSTATPSPTEAPATLTTVPATNTPTEPTPAPTGTAAGDSAATRPEPSATLTDLPKSPMPPPEPTASPPGLQVAAVSTPLPPPPGAGPVPDTTQRLFQLGVVGLGVLGLAAGLGLLAWLAWKRPA